MFQYRQQRPCRNGPNCYYLRQGTCWFYHPHQHSNSQLFNYFGTNSSSSLMRPSANGLILRPFSEVSFENPRYSSIQALLGKLRQLNLRSSNLDKLGQEKQQLKQVVISGKKVQLVSISTALSKQKSWFFKNSYHFNHFPECQFLECSICISNFKNQELLSTLLCQHAFHPECIQKWLQKSDHCPLCRKDFRVHDQFKSMKGYVQPTIAKKPSYLLSYNGIDISDYEDDEEEIYPFDRASISISDGQDEQFDIYSLNESYGFGEVDEFDDFQY